jgi:hypothetical protein
MKLSLKQITRLQIILGEWVEQDGGPFGKALERDEVETVDAILDLAEVSLRMAEAAAAVYTLAASASGRSCESVSESDPG